MRGMTMASTAGDVFQLMRDGRPRTKSELADLTGLSRSTLGHRVDSLIDFGLLRPAGEAHSTGGRPPAQLAFNPRAGAVFAVDFGATHVSVAIADLAGTVLVSDTATIDIADGPAPLLTQAMDTGATLLNTCDGLEPTLFGVGIGLPGPVEHATGMAICPPIMPGWDRFDVPGFIRQRFEVPVCVDNDVNVLALGEQASSWPDVRDLIFVKVATGIGAGIIAGGILQRGAQGSAGDLGHVHVPHSSSARSVDDQRDLEAIASGTAIAQELRASGLDVAASGDVVDLLRAGNADAIAATREAGRTVGEVLAGVVNLLNPSIIVLGGSIARAGEHLLAGVREVVYRRSIPLATQHLSIVQTQAGDLAAVAGAAIMAAQQALAPSRIDAAIADRSGMHH